MADPGDVRMWDLAQERYVPAVTGRGVRMDVEKARGVVRELETLADELAQVRFDLQPIAVTPAASDPVSGNVAAQASRMLSQSRAFLASWHEDLHAAIRALTSQVDAYGNVDTRNSARL